MSYINNGGGGGGGGAPTDASYLVVSLNGSLTADRALTAGTGVTFVDGGANSTFTVSIGQAVATTSTPQFARLGLGEVADANIILAMTQAAAGPALRVTTTATSYITAMGTIHLLRTGALIGVATESLSEINIIPAFTLTEPGSGTFTYYGANIDLSSIAVTAAAGTTALTALRLAANADADVGTNLALHVDVGRSLFDDILVFGAGSTPIAGEYSFGRNTATAFIANVPTGSTFNIQVNASAEYNFSATSLDMISNDLRWTSNGSVTASATQIARITGVLVLNNASGAAISLRLNNVESLGVSGTAITASVPIDLSSISAGSSNLTITATSDTPTVAFTGGANAPTTAPAGYMEITVGGNARYIPFWA